jgi:hypothetical protein
LNFLIENLIEQENSLNCPDKCALCSREMTCLKCVDNWIIRNDGKCIDGTFENIITVLQRVDLFKDELYEYQINPNSNVDASIGLWLRKKTHSVVPEKPTHSLLTVIDEDGQKNYFNYSNYNG